MDARKRDDDNETFGRAFDVGVSEHKLPSGSVQSEAVHRSTGGQDEHRRSAIERVASSHLSAMIWVKRLIVVDDNKCTQQKRIEWKGYDYKFVAWL